MHDTIRLPLSFRRLLQCTALIAVALGSVGAAPAQTPPEPPIISEPEFDGQILNSADVHMEVQPMIDADGDTHLCTDFEIWTLSPLERVWATLCIGGVEKLHTHLGDGNFLGTHGDLSELLYDTDYELRVRFFDSSGDSSAWTARPFHTGDPSVVFPLSLTDVLASPVPQLLDPNGAPYLLPGSAALRIDAPDSLEFLRIEAAVGDSNRIVDAAPRLDHAFARVVFEGGASGLATPDLDLRFTDDDGVIRTIYLPGTAVDPGDFAYFWVGVNGATFQALPGETVPALVDLARSGPVPWKAITSGFRTELVATGFQLPVNIAFVPQPAEGVDAPYFYVTELYGTVKVVSRGFTVSDYATGLLNFDPTGAFPGSGEQGLAGIVVDPATGDVIVGTLYDSNPPNGAHFPKVLRLHSEDGGLTASSIQTILDMPGETQGQSHFISNLSLGPDGKLYVHMGDGFDASTALNLDSFRGKVLRLELDGSACTDNPFYDDADGISARDYVWAYGLRNPFGGAWRASDGQHYSVENGPSSNDRFAKITAGTSYGWDGSAASMLINAAYVWNPTHAPVNIAFVENETFGGSRFPVTLRDRAYVTESGPTWATGAQTRGKRIVSFGLDANGVVTDGPKTVVEYNGVGKATAVGLTAGPDGLYFTDLYKDVDYVTPIDAGANVLRVRWIGRADFLASARVGQPPFAVRFTDVSDVPTALGRTWDFGDGTTSTERNPIHEYTTPGVYDVRLEVVTPQGLITEQKNSMIIVGQSGTGLLAEIFDTRFLDGTSISRIDPVIDFNWGSGSPDPSIEPNTFSIRWSGRITVPSSDDWTFTTRTDDGVRLWIGGQLLIDKWIDQSPTDHSATVNLAAGDYDIRMEMYENGGGAVARLSWSSPSQPLQVVPTTALSAVAIQQATGTTPSPIDRSVTLLPNRPNPFNPRTQIAFRVASEGIARVEVYDLRGRRVATPLRDATIGAGEHTLVFEGVDDHGRALASGAYVYRLSFRPRGLGADEVRSGRMVLLK